MFLSQSEAWAAAEAVARQLAHAGLDRSQVQQLPVEQLLSAAQATPSQAAWLRALPLCPLHLEGTAQEPMQHYALTRAAICLHLALVGRSGGARAGGGRPKGSTQLDAARQARYARWLAWWPTRPAPQLSAYALADILDKPKSTVRAVASGHRLPNAALLDNLERISRQLGFEPLATPE